MKLRLEKCMSSRAFTDPTRNIQDNYLKIDGLCRRLENQIKTKHKEEQSKYLKLVAQLDALSPLKTLMRGYGIVESKKRIVKTVKDLCVNEDIDIKFQDGTVRATVQDIKTK